MKTFNNVHTMPHVQIFSETTSESLAKLVPLAWMYIPFFMATLLLFLRTSIDADVDTQGYEDDTHLLA